jgi:hypothetical protein
MIKSKTLSNTQHLTQEARQKASTVARRRRVRSHPLRHLYLKIILKSLMTILRNNFNSPGYSSQ